MNRLLAVYFACFAANGWAQSLPTSNTQLSITLRSVCQETFTSPNVSCHQGYTTDGTNHYTIDTQSICKRADDPQWSIIVSNTAPFDGLPNLQHLGDGDYHNGKLYIVGEWWSWYCNFSNQSILVFDADTLTRLEVHDISAQQHEVSGCCVVPEEGSNGVIYVTSYCDGSRLFKYDLATFAFVGTLPLSRSINSIQGVTTHNGTFYISSDAGAIFTADANGNVNLFYTTTLPGSHEGLDFSQNELRWLIDNGGTNRCVHYISPTGSTVSWPGFATNNILEEATDLSGIWTAVTNKCITNTFNGSCTTLPTLSIPSGNKFYRLRPR
jgi:hypothetical protein